MPENEHSWPPWILGILRKHNLSQKNILPLPKEIKENKTKTHFQTTTFSAGTYFAFPVATWQSTFVVFNGVGILNTTFVALSLLLKFVLTVTSYDTLLVPISVTVGMTRRGSLTFDVARYLRQKTRDISGRIFSRPTQYEEWESSNARSVLLTSSIQIHHPVEQS